MDLSFPPSNNVASPPSTLSLPSPTGLAPAKPKAGWREGMKGRGKFIFHPHPPPPPSRGREKFV